MDCIVGHGQLRARLKYRRRGGRRNVTGDETKEICVAKEQTTERSLAKPGRLLQHSLEHRLQLTRRAANNLEHVRGCGLLLERLAQFVKQPRILNGDDGLGGEVLHQRLLLIVEGRTFVLVDLDDADQILFLQHRNGKLAAHAGELNDRRLHRIVHIARHLLYVGYLTYLLGFQYAAKASIRGGPNKWRAPSGL